MILITGGMGFIGLHTARALIDAGETVLVTRFRASRLPAFLEAERGTRFLDEAADVTAAHDLIDLALRHEVDGIVHLANPGFRPVSAAEDYRINMQGLINVLEAGRVAGVKRISVASSIAVYQGLPGGPFAEDAPLPMASHNTIEAYKKAQEILAGHWADRTGVDVALLRIASIYGPLYHSMVNAPARMLHAALQGLPGPLPHGTLPPPFAEDSLDLCHVADCARGIAMVQLAERLPHRIYNIGSGEAATNAALAAAVRAAVPGADIRVEPGRGPRHRPQVTMDLGRIGADLGYRPRFTLESGIADYAAWLRAGNPQ